MFYFTPLTGVLFTFPSQYLFTIGHQSVFSLTGWSRLIHTGFHVPRITWDNSRGSEIFAYRTVTVFGRPFQICSTILIPSLDGVPRPLRNLRYVGLGCSPFTRRY
jgi:hypothetical protein